MSRAFLFLLAVLCLATACKKSVETNLDINHIISVATNDLAKYNVLVSTIAGKYGIQGDDDGNGSKARFWNPTKMVYDNRNNVLYVTDGTVIRSVDQNNNVKTYLPFGKINNFDEILDIDVTPDSIGGSLYFITEENCLYKIEPKGTSYKLTAIVKRVYGGNELGKLNKKDHFDIPRGVATGKDGNVYFFNESWNTIHYIDFTSTAPYDGTVKKFAGKPSTDRGGESGLFQDGIGENATFGRGVWDMCADGHGNLYVADYSDDLVRKVTPAGAVTSLFQYEQGLGVDVDGPVSQAQANRVDHVSATQNGKSIYFTTYGRVGYKSPALRVVKPGIDVTTLVGKNPTNWGDGSGDVAGFGEIGGIATTADGKTVYVSEVANKVIRKVTIQ